MNCFSENTLRAYRDDELDSAERARVENHITVCPQCRARLEEIAAVADRIAGRLSALEGISLPRAIDPQIAFARFKARYGGGEASAPFFARLLARRWRAAWVTGIAALFILLGLAFPFGRSLAQRFLATLRVERVQPVRLDFSALDQNRPLQDLLAKMISDKTVLTIDEKPQPAASAGEASQLAGFTLRLPAALTDTPQLTVLGEKAFHLTIDRARLQDIFDQAGRPDLLLPATLDGAVVSVRIPRAVRVLYGDCPHENEDQALQNPSQRNCTLLLEVPSPAVNVPGDLNLQQLAEIGLQLAGMSATQAREICQTIDWKSTLVLPIPRYVTSYSVVEVNGTQGTLINQLSRYGNVYALIWVKNGIIYSLVGHGDVSTAVPLANSLD